MNEELKADGIKDLIEKGKKRGTLSYTEIMDSLQGIDLSPDQMDEVYENFMVLGLKWSQKWLM